MSLHLPPVGLLRMFLQLLQATTTWAWLKMVAVSLQPPSLDVHEVGVGVGHQSLQFVTFLLGGEGRVKQVSVHLLRNM